LHSSLPPSPSALSLHPFLYPTTPLPPRSTLFPYTTLFRSLFVWHTGEEAGLTGSNFFTHNPTVPLDSVVAQINIDMIGRGRAERSEERRVGKECRSRGAGDH